MDSTFDEIESYSGEHSHRQGRGIQFLYGSGLKAIWPANYELEENLAPSNASISDEQVAGVARQGVVLERVQALEAMYLEDYGDSLQIASRLGYECFMRYSPMAAMPLLGAEPSGVLIATWNKGSECLSLRFLDRYHLDFAVTYLDGDRIVRRWGKSSLSTLFGECPKVKDLIAN